MIIVEGPDGAGKTMLVNRLSADLSLEIGKRGVENRDELWKVTRQDTHRALAEAMHGPVKVWDRLYFSEDIYSAITGRESQFSPSDKAFIEKVLELMKCPIIVCLPPFPVVVANVVGTHQLEGVRPNLSKIHKLYRELWLGLDVYKAVNQKLHLIKYDYTSSSEYNSLRNEVQMYLNRRGDR